MPLLPTSTLVLTAAATAVISFLLCAVATQYVTRLGRLAQPGERHSHTSAMPTGVGLGIILALAVAVIYMIIFIERGQRRITVNYAKRQQGRKLYAAQSSHLPPKINMAGALPPHFASAILLLSAILAGWFCGTGEGGGAWLLGVALLVAPGPTGHVLWDGGWSLVFCFF